VTERRGRRGKQLLDDVKDTRLDLNWKRKHKIVLDKELDLEEVQTCRKTLRHERKGEWLNMNGDSTRGFSFTLDTLYATLMSMNIEFLYVNRLQI